MPPGTGRHLVKTSWPDTARRDTWCRGTLRCRDRVALLVMSVVNRGRGAGANDDLGELPGDPERGGAGDDLGGSVSPNEGFGNDAAGTLRGGAIMRRLGVHPARTSFHEATGNKRPRLGRAKGYVNCGRNEQRQPHQLVNILTCE